MKSIISTFCTLMTVAFVFVGCKGSSAPENQPDVPPVDKVIPTIEISQVASKSTSVTFTLTPCNATRYGYSVTEDGSTSDLTTVMSSKAQEIKVDKLSTGKEYTICASAYSRDDEASEVAKFTFVTEDVVTYPRNSLCYKFTGSWCVNCPYMTNAIDAANEELDGKIIVAAIHSEQTPDLVAKFESEDGNEILDDWKVVALPTAIVDLRDNCSQDPNAFIRAYERSEESYPSTAKIVVASDVVDGDAHIEVDVEFGASGNYRIGVIIVENNIEAAGTEGSFDGLYHHVVRDFVTDVDGDALGKKDLGDSVSEDYIYSVKDGENVDNMEVIVFVSKDYGANDFYVSSVESVSLK